jgi:hypothetical protein
VTTDHAGQILKATGVPPTVEIAQNSKKVLALCIQTLEGVQAMGKTVKDAVFQAFEHRAIKKGQMTTQQMKDMLLQSQQEMQTFASQQIASFRNEAHVVLGEDAQHVTDDDDDDAVFADGMDGQVGEVGGPGCMHIADGCGKLQKISNFQKSHALSAMTGCCGLLGCLDMR